MATVVSLSDTEQHSLLTAEEFLAWLNPGVHADLIDGEIVMHSPVNLKHANLLNFVDHLLRSYIELKKLGRLYREVVAVRLSVRQVYMPDLAFFTTHQVPRLKETHAPLAPTLVVEALSPGTAANDVGDKFASYEFHGVQEYWILDPNHLAHRFYRREGELLVEFGAGEAVIRAVTLPGLWLKRIWLNPDSPPEVTACLREISADQSAGAGDGASPLT